MRKHQVIRAVGSLLIIGFFVGSVGLSVSSGFGNKCTSMLLISKQQQQEASVFMYKVFTLFQQNRVAGLSSISDSKYINNMSQFAASMRDFIPKAAPVSKKLIGLKKYFRGKTDIIDASFEYKFAKRWLLIDFAYYKYQQQKRLVGMHVRYIPSSLESINNVSFLNFSKVRFLALLFTLLVPLIIVIAAISCIYTDMEKRKWLWLIFILLGFVNINFNWTTQLFSVTPIGFQVLGASWFRASCYAPLILGFSLPVGAIIFLIKRLCSFNLHKETKRPNDAL